MHTCTNALTQGINKGMGPPISGPASSPLHPHTRAPPTATPGRKTPPAPHPTSPQHPASLHPALASSLLPASAAAAAAAAAQCAPPDPVPSTPASAAGGAGARSAHSGQVLGAHRAPDLPHIPSPARLVPVTINISRPDALQGQHRHGHQDHAGGGAAVASAAQLASPPATPAAAVAGPVQQQEADAAGWVPLHVAAGVGAHVWTRGPWMRAHVGLWGWECGVCLLCRNVAERV